MNKKLICFLSYFTLVGFFIALLCKRIFFQRDQEISFHLRQSLGNMLFFSLINILLIVGFYNTDSIVSKDHILNNGKEFSQNEYKDLFINEDLFSKSKYPKSDRIELDDKLIEEIASEENLLSPINLIYQFNIPGYFLFKKLIPQKKLKNQSKYQNGVVAYLQGMKSLLDEKRATQIIKYGGNSEMDEKLYDRLQGLNLEIQTAFIPYQKERKQAIVNYISSTLEDNSVKWINILNTPIHFKFLSESIFWSAQIFFILIWLISLVSIFHGSIKIPILGWVYQKLFYFI